MSKNTDNSDSPDLLNALESIKGLLEQSENKLSAARESLKKAKSPDTSQGIIRPSVSSDPVVPVLDDVVAPSAELPEYEEPSLLEEVPELDSFLEPEETIPAEPPQEPIPPGHSTDEVIACLDQLQEQLEKELTDNLAQAIVNIKAELKKSLDAEIQKLKDQLTQADSD